MNDRQLPAHLRRPATGRLPRRGGPADQDPPSGPARGAGHALHRGHHPLRRLPAGPRLDPHRAAATHPRGPRQRHRPRPGHRRARLLRDAGRGGLRHGVLRQGAFLDLPHLRGHRRPGEPDLLGRLRAGLVRTLHGLRPRGDHGRRPQLVPAREAAEGPALRALVPRRRTRRGEAPGVPAQHGGHERRGADLALRAAGGLAQLHLDRRPGHRVAEAAGARRRPVLHLGQLPRPPPPLRLPGTVVTAARPGGRRSAAPTAGAPSKAARGGTRRC